MGAVEPFYQTHTKLRKEMLGVREAVLVREAVYELIIFLISSCLKWVRRPFFFSGMGLALPSPDRNVSAVRDVPL